MWRSFFTTGGIPVWNDPTPSFPPEGTPMGLTVIAVRALETVRKSDSGVFTLHR